LHLVRTNVTMLLAVSHDNAQFIRLPLDGVFPSVHGAEFEHGGPRSIGFESLGHPLQNLRGQLPSQWKYPRPPGAGLPRVRLTQSRRRVEAF
jgi:hypothetical protein